MPALANDLLALSFQRQTVDLDNVIENPGEYLHDLTKGLPIKVRRFGERIDHELGEVYGAQQA
jgi:hypothetical protein